MSEWDAAQADFEQRVGGILGVFSAGEVELSPGSNPRGQCPVCGGGEKSKSALSVQPEIGRAKCFACDRNGDALDWAVWLSDPNPPPGAKREFLREQGLLGQELSPLELAARRRRSAEISARRARETAAAQAEAERASAELRQACQLAWDSAPPLGPAGADWIRSRGPLDPDQVRGLDLARAACGADLRGGLRPLRRAGALLPFWDLQGELLSLQARGGDLGDANGRPLKSRSPTGGRTFKGVFANPLGVELLRGGPAPPGPVIVAEGGPDCLVWSARRPELPVFGVVSGSAAPLGARLAELGVDLVAIRTDPGNTGDRYAEEFAAELEGAELLRPVVRDQGDDGDRFKRGTLPLDPLEDCEAWPCEKRIAPSPPLPEFPSGLAPDLAEGELEQRLLEFFRAALRGEAAPAKALAIATPTGTGKTYTAARALLTALAELGPKAAAGDVDQPRRPVVWAAARHEQLDDLLVEALPKVAEGLGHAVELERDSLDRPLRAEVQLGPGALVFWRVPEWACDPRLPEEEQRKTREYRERLSKAGDDTRAACHGCRFYKPAERWKRERVSVPEGGWCRYWKDAAHAKDAGRPRKGEADVVLVTHRRLVTARPSASLFVVDEDLSAELAASSEPIGAEELAAYAKRLDELERKAGGLVDKAKRKGEDRELSAWERRGGVRALRRAAEELERALGTPSGPRFELEQPKGVDADLGAQVAGWAWREGSKIQAAGPNLARPLGAILEAWAADTPAVLLCTEWTRGKATAVVVPLRRRLPASTPLVYLDATLIPEVAALLERDLELVEGLTSSERERWASLQAVQVTGEVFGKKKLDESQALAHKAARRGVRMLLRLEPAPEVLGAIGPKGLAGEEGAGLLAHVHRRAFVDEGLPSPELRAELYHGALTGSNALSAADAGHVVGMPAVTPWALQLLALHLRPDATDEEIVEKPRFRKVKIGDHVGKLFCYLPGTPMGLAWRARVLAPLAQAGGRFHRGARCAKALVFSNAVPFPYPLPLLRRSWRALQLEGERELARAFGFAEVLGEDVSARAVHRALGCNRRKAADLLELLASLPQATASRPSWSAAIADGRQRAQLELVRRLFERHGPEVIAERSGLPVERTRRWFKRQEPGPQTILRVLEKFGFLGAIGQGPVSVRPRPDLGGKAMEPSELRPGQGGANPYRYIDRTTASGFAGALSGLRDQLGAGRVSALLGVSERTVRRWLSGATTPGREHRQRIELLEAEFAEFLFGCAAQQGPFRELGGAAVVAYLEGGLLEELACWPSELAQAWERFEALLAEGAA